MDRLPFVETAQFNMVTACREDWPVEFGDGEEVLRRFGFDNAGCPSGFESVPVDWYAVPRYDERKLPGEDGYLRVVDGRYGRVSKAIPAHPPEVPFRVRIFEGHVVGDRSDWNEVRERFRPTVEGRFPDDWEAWCEHSRRADHPIVLDIRDIAANINNLMGEELFYASFFEMPDLVREMVAQLSELTLACVEKALREARVDMVRVGSDCTPLIGPNAIRDFFLEAEARHVELAKSCGVDLVCLQGRGDITHVIEPYREIGANGVHYVMEIGEADFLEAILDRYGDSIFVIGILDGRILLRDFDPIERAVVQCDIKVQRKFSKINKLHEFSKN